MHVKLNINSASIQRFMATGK